MAAVPSDHSPAPNPALEHSALTKVKWRLLPILILGLFISYMDRANLAVLSKPMSEDLGLSASTFGLVAGLFYIGYLFFEIPSNIALARFGARLWIARIMITWGLTTVALMFAGGETSLMILRFLLGVAEAGFFPGVLLYLTFWFPPRALGKAYSLFEQGIPAALALATLCTSALLLLDGWLGLDGWRWAFLLQGLPAVLLGIVILFVLPDRPAKASWLTPAEREYLEAEVVTTGTEHAGDRRLVARLLCSGTAWLFSAMYFAMVIGFWSITYWLSQIVGERFDVGAVEAGFISALPWVLAAIAIVVIARTSTRSGDRRWHIFGCLMTAGIGLYLSAAVESPIIALVGLGLGAAGMQAAVPLFWAQTSTVFVGASAAVALAMVNSIGNVSGFVGPYVLGFFQDVTESSRTGLYIMCGFFVVAAVLSFATSRVASQHAVPGPPADGQQQPAHL